MCSCRGSGHKNQPTKARNPISTEMFAQREAEASAPREDDEGSATADRQPCPEIDAEDIDSIQSLMISRMVKMAAVRLQEPGTSGLMLPPPTKFIRKNKQNRIASHQNRMYSRTVESNPAIENIYRSHRQFVAYLIKEQEVAADFSSDSLWHEYEYLFRDQ
jgi:hypothetical protein